MVFLRKFALVDEDSGGPNPSSLPKFREGVQGNSHTSDTIFEPGATDPVYRNRIQPSGR